MIIITDSNCLAYSMAGHPERPDRISATTRYLQKEMDISWERPSTFEESVLLAAHAPRHLQTLKEERAFDPDTPWYEGIDVHARRSVGAALHGLDLIKKGRPSFSLMRPPGHHACTEKAMGFCYLNQAAIVALEAGKQGLGKVAVYDFDVHHGNGTEDILKNRENFAFYSVHQYPCYPGTGKDSFGNIHNYPVPPGPDRKPYLETLAGSLEELKKWRPDLIVVSAGFDAYHKDPLSEAPLLTEDFQWIGEEIKAIGAPFFSLLEGGYSPDLPELILEYLKGAE
jgi:acetoin utilization deacetylase AcuC-like enzyme